jgi:hypothetical protein
MKNILQYIIRNFNVVYDHKLDPDNISWGEVSIDGINIRRTENGYFDRRDPLVTSAITWRMWKGISIPFIFNSESDLEILTETETGVHINFDIISASFFFLSGWQEYVSDSKDRYGRFEYSGSIQKILGITKLPIVNYYFDILKCAAEIKLKKKISEVNWEGREISVCLTHDIDNCESAWKQGSYRELLKGNLFAPFKLVFKKIFLNDDWFNIKNIISLEQSYGISSTYFFLAESSSINGIPNADYDLNNLKYRNIIDKLVAGKFEIGIHGSTGSHTDLKRLTTDIRKTGVEVKGNRFHFLLYDVMKTPSVLEKSGLKYDTSLGFAEAPGFRYSYCHPFYLYNIQSGQISDIIEIPLIVMDVTFEKGYLNSGKEEALRLMMELFGEIKKFKGCLTILWHNTFFSDYKFSGWREIYCRFVEFALDNGALMTGGAEIYKIIDDRDI